MNAWTVLWLWATALLWQVSAVVFWLTHSTNMCRHGPLCCRHGQLSTIVPRSRPALTAVVNDDRMAVLQMVTFLTCCLEPTQMSNVLAGLRCRQLALNHSTASTMHWESSSCILGVGDWNAEVQLAVISILVQCEVIRCNDGAQVSRVQNEQQTCHDQCLQYAVTNPLYHWWQATVYDW